ncbi:MAG: pyridoxal-phosphate dependent enzyme [Deltaproteobacteria bacterium]|nr:pyridoxal-phosphate dependent enzyme [Deltaproteobacteria bacterium]
MRMQTRLAGTSDFGQDRACVLDQGPEGTEPAVSYLFGPTFSEMKAPEQLPEQVREAARIARAADPMDPMNLFNLHWEDDLGEVLAVVMPSELTGVAAPIALLVGSKFPTGSIKVGPAYAILAEKQVFGELQPGRDRLVVPSSGSFATALAWVASRLGYAVHAVLPDDVSSHHVRALDAFGASVELVARDRASLSSVMTAAQRAAEELHSVLIDPWSEFGSYRFHALVTASAIEKLALRLGGQGVGRGVASAFVASVGSGGTLGAGSALRARHGTAVIAVEPFGASPLFDGGFGSHRLRDVCAGIVPWILDTSSTDGVACVSDVDALRGLALLEESGQWLVEDHGIREDVASRLRGLFGLSGVANFMGAIKTVKKLGLGPNDLVVTIAPDGADADKAALETLASIEGPVGHDATIRRVEMLRRVATDGFLEGRDATKRWHNQKYYPWVDGRGKSAEALEAQRTSDFWSAQRERGHEIDRRILELRPPL